MTETTYKIMCRSSISSLWTVLWRGMLPLFPLVNFSGKWRPMETLEESGEGRMVFHGWELGGMEVLGIRRRTASGVWG